METFIAVLLITVLLYVFKGIVIVQEQQEVIVERLGSYERKLTAGLNFIFPIFEAPRSILRKEWIRDGNKNYAVLVAFIVKKLFKNNT